MHSHVALEFIKDLHDRHIRGNPLSKDGSWHKFQLDESDRLRIICRATISLLSKNWMKQEDYPTTSTCTCIQIKETHIFNF